jgi:alkylation response protein AidB-like acyl-CoA dehydrogenase
MAAVSEKKDFVLGGSFLIEERTTEEVFTPEDFTEEQRMIGDTTREFVDNEVRPNIPALEGHAWELARDLIKQAGDLGLLGVNVPEELGGLALDQVSGTIVAETVGRAAAFGVTMGAQTSIGLLPILYFGSEELKKKYVPRIVTGEMVTAYCLSEAGSGSDALGAKASAKLSEDGTHYILNGEKMWISNGGFADMYVVFAKVNGEKEKFSAFVVERSESCRPGAEEHKMGIKASSTTPLILSDAKVPVENLIGNVGDGAKIAFNILNIGRYKLGASCIGGAKLMIDHAVKYANERHQFNKPISSFGAIKHKLAEMAIRCWVGESMCYRTVGMIDSLIGSATGGDTKLRAIEEYAVECSIDKVACSEYCDYVADEMVQIYGGYGYSADYPAEKAYRDSRINRIFEGTNEINRMLIPGMLMKRAMKGKLPLMAAAQKLMDEVMSPSMPSFDEDEGVLAAEVKLVQNAKKVALMVAGTAAQKYMMALSEQQEVLIGIADIVIDIFAMETAVLRARKMAATKGEEASARYLDMACVFCNDAIERIETSAKNTLAAMSEGDELRTLLAALRRFTKHTPINTVAARQRIADVLIKANKYAY